MKARKLVAATLLGTVLYLLAAAAPAQSQSLVGSWYGEIAQTGNIEGRSYDLRRWLRTNFPDGRQLLVFRYYLDGQLQVEEQSQGKWSLENGVYTTICESFSLGGKVRSCIGKVEYDMSVLNEREMQYRSRSSGLTYRMVRVPTGYRLP